MRKADVSPEKWIARMAYEREWKTRHKVRHHQQQLESQRRRLADPEKRAAYNALQAKYRAEKRPYKKPPPHDPVAHQRAKATKNGWPADVVEKLRIAQGNRCAICSREFGATKKTNSLHCDHDHASGMVRGLLCFRCNAAEGFIRASGLSPQDFAERLHGYLLNPPASRL